MNAHSLIRHTSLAFTFILSSIILSKILPNQIDIQHKYDKSNIRTLSGFNIITPTEKFGFAIDTFSTADILIKEGETFLSILNGFTSDNQVSHNIVRTCKGKVNLNLIKPGMKLTLLRDKVSNESRYLVLEPDVYKYIVFDLKDPDKLKITYKPVDKSIEVVSGIMEGSLWQTIRKYQMDPALAEQMEDAMECAFDLSRAGRGDMIKLVYEKNVIEGEEVDAGRLLAAYYKGKLGEKHVFWFENKNQKGYFDEAGRPMRKSFLKAPLKYARISSSYSAARLHPVLNKLMPHFGTDFAAPYGTPIISVSDGVVEAASYSNGNGRFVKIKHNATYATQYLHMSRFANGIRKGAKVRQGQVIGYVGSSGLATGPHVCFRFWKNGVQCNPARLNLPAPDPMPGSDLSIFKSQRNDLIQKLAAIGKPIPGQKFIRQSNLDGLLFEKP